MENKKKNTEDGILRSFPRILRAFKESSRR